MKLRLILLFALAVPLPLVAAPAKKPTKAIKKTPVLVWPRISRIQNSDWTHPIRALQYLLNYRGVKINVDGKFGAQTEAAVKQFQRKHKLKADGFVGPQTWDKLIVRVKRGDKGNAVRAVQAALNGKVDHIGQPICDLKEDGIFGSETQDVVRSFQEGDGTYYLKIDGIVGLQTWCILVGGYLNQ